MPKYGYDDRWGWIQFQFSIFILQHKNFMIHTDSRGVIWGGWGSCPYPPPPRNEKNRKKTEKKKKKRKKGTMNNDKLLHIKVLFFPIFQ